MSIISKPYSKAAAANHERIFGPRKSSARGRYTLSVAKRERGGRHHPGLREGVATHKVPRGTAPDDYDPPTITFTGSKDQFKDDIQRAYDNHPDEQLRGYRVYLDNT